MTEIPRPPAAFKISGTIVSVDDENISITHKQKGASKRGIPEKVSVPLGELNGVGVYGAPSWTASAYLHFDTGVPMPDVVLRSPYVVAHVSNDNAAKSLVEELRQRRVPLAEMKATVNIENQLIDARSAAKTEDFSVSVNQAARAQASRDKMRARLLEKVPELTGRDDVLDALAVGLAGNLTGTLGLKRELKALPSKLEEGERVFHAHQCWFPVGDKEHSGLAVITDRRLLAYALGMFVQQSEVSYPLESITAVAVVTESLTKAKVVVSGSGYSGEVYTHDNTRLQANLRSMMNARQDSNPAQVRIQDSSQPPAPVADRLRQLKALHTEGLLDDDEFRAKKAALLDEL